MAEIPGGKMLRRAQHDRLRRRSRRDGCEPRGGRCRNKFGMTGYAEGSRRDGCAPTWGKPLDGVCFGVGNPSYDPGEIELGGDPEASSG
jgi:hypothetical protein